MNVEKLNKVIDFLKKLPANQFYLGNVITLYDENMCGSVCCVVGHFPRIFEDRCTWSPQIKGTNAVTLDGEATDFCDIFEELIEVSPSDAEILTNVTIESNVEQALLDVIPRELYVTAETATPADMVALYEWYRDGGADDIAEAYKAMS